MQKNDLDQKKFRSMLKNADRAGRELLAELWGKHRPADRTLSSWFRENRQCGSRDRQFISTVLYALLRYWGLLRTFLPEERRKELEQGIVRLGAAELPALFFGALYLEFQELAWADRIAAEFHIPWPKPQNGPLASLTDRAEALAKVFGEERHFSEEMLLPDWVAPLLPEDFPLDRFLKGLQRRPPMWLRSQTPDVEALVEELAEAGLNVRRHPSIERAVAVENSRVNLFTLPAFRAGKFEVQDLASQCIGLAAHPKAKSRWWDACAGAGGKTLQLAERMGGTGTVVASDVRSYKLDDLRQRARRAGFSNIVTRAWDGKTLPAKQQGKFDGVLVDAPCSCSGVWRRNPDGRWILTEAEVRQTSELQKSILAAAAPAVTPGGILVYATCSIFPCENREVVDDFLANHPEFELEGFRHPFADGEIKTDGTLQICSFDGDCDSMFVARMRRRKTAEAEA